MGRAVGHECLQMMTMITLGISLHYNEPLPFVAITTWSRSSICTLHTMHVYLLTSPYILHSFTYSINRYVAHIFTPVFWNMRSLSHSLFSSTILTGKLYCVNVLPVEMEYRELLFQLETEHSNKELYRIIVQSRSVQMISY